MNSSPGNPVEFGRRETAPEAPQSTQPLAGSPEANRVAQATPARAQAVPANAASPASARRSRGSRSQFIVFLNFLMTLLVFAVIGAGLFFLSSKRAFEQPGPLVSDSTFIVKPNSGLSAISTDLAAQGLITSSTVFAMGVRAHGDDGTLKAGEYEIKARASMSDIMETLKSGRSIMYSITIPEGLTVEQAFQRVAETAELSGKMPAQMPPEGSLAADTQRFTRGMPRTVIIDKMVEDQKKLVDTVWQTRSPDLPITDINEFVTLASIVEKETGVAAERPRVASVFVNRLKKGMRLQSDPTILYGLFGGKGRPADRAIFQSDIQKPTPYNTYVIDGLPPGPIANPGKAALEAVANPAKTEDLYFVADGTGGHVFASTLQEHNKNVAKWRAIQKQQKDAPEQGETTQQ